jgi:hypothetical protein
VSGAGATGASSQAGNLAAATPAPARTPTVVATSRPAATVAPGQAPPAPTGPAAISYVADKTFVQRAGVWTDTAYQQGSDTRKVTFASDEYFELLAQKPELAQFFALGTRVIVVLDGVAYEVTE